jgi:hypothetical protein
VNVLPKALPLPPGQASSGPGPPFPRDVVTDLLAVALGLLVVLVFLEIFRTAVQRRRNE